MAHPVWIIHQNFFSGSIKFTIIINYVFLKPDHNSPAIRDSGRNNTPTDVLLKFQKRRFLLLMVKYPNIRKCKEHEFPLLLLY